MHYFTVNSEDNRHLGFLVLMADDSHDAAPDRGCFAIKAQAGMDEQHRCTAQWHVLTALTTEPMLYWQRRNDELRLLNAAGDELGCLKHHHLQLNGQRFVLQDLSGTL